jgi:molybdenum cofactor biosynthesis enzyme MoaA
MKLSDKFGRAHNYLRISVTEKCNFRCTYCMPEEGVELSKNVLETSEISKLVRIFVKQCGVTKIRITGGEPTVRKDLDAIISDIRSHPEIESIGITSNGALLPRKLEMYA